MVNRFVLKSDNDNVYGYLDSLDDFVNTVPILPEKVLKFHINDSKNDFQQWLIHEFKLELKVPTSEADQAVDFLCSRIREHLFNERIEILNKLPSTLNEEVDLGLEMMSLFPPPDSEKRLFEELFL